MQATLLAEKNVLSQKIESLTSKTADESAERSTEQGWSQEKKDLEDSRDAAVAKAKVGLCYYTFVSAKAISSLPKNVRRKRL